MFVRQNLAFFAGSGMVRLGALVPAIVSYTSSA
jgi:hypothetical protein